MKNVLKVAEENGFKRIALPPMGTGYYGIPLEVSARIMLESIREHTGGETGLEEVILCVLDKRDYRPFEAEFKKLA
jgi:O-acetyl-ADP-ribose deacetylase (regulator of RNase III)